MRGSVLTLAARELRRQMTPAETVLWSRLRRHQMGYHFRRQLPIGQYIVDFVCLQHKLVVEIDGQQHLGSAQDRERDCWLRAQRYRVLRFWNEEVLNDLESVLLTITRALESCR